MGLAARRPALRETRRLARAESGLSRCALSNLDHPRRRRDRPELRVRTCYQISGIYGMKELLLTFIVALTLITSLSAIPLTQFIRKENDRLTAKIEAWSKQCGGKPSYDEDCMKKRYKLCAELGQFVALANDEVIALEDLSPNTLPSDREVFDTRRKFVEHLIRVALYNIKCLGRPASDPQCSGESAALDAEKAAIQAKYGQQPQKP